METSLSGTGPFRNRREDARRILTFAVFIFTAGFILGGCVGKEPSHDDLFSSNQPPIANAGPDQSVESGAQVQLDGSKSVDPQAVPIAYTWRMTEKPAGSGAALSSGEAVNPSFVADVDGQYRLELVVSEKVEITLPAGVPASSIVVPTSGPDEVVITAGKPGPFPNSGNKLLLDGKHLGITILPMSIGGNISLTAEGWFWIDRVPAAGQETLLFGKEAVFELVLKSDSTVLFRWFKPGSTPVETPAVFLTLKEWHHLAAVLDPAPSRAYLAVDGKISARASFVGGLNTKDEKRFVVGGGEPGKAFLFGMADEIRVAQDIRYPEADFTPPSSSLTQDNPFANGFQNSVHGLWRFDEIAGSTLFRDVSLRTNDLFLVTETGFRPFGRLAHGRIFHTAVALKNQNIWIAGGIDDAGNSAPESEKIDFGSDQISVDAGITLPTVENIAVNDQIGFGDGSRKVFITTLPFNPLGTSMTITTDAFRAEDDSQGRLIFNRAILPVSENGVNYSAGTVTVKFSVAPDPGSIQVTANLVGANGVLSPKSAKEGSGDVVVTRSSDDKTATVHFLSPISAGSVVVTVNTVTIKDSRTDSSSKGILTGRGVFGTVDYTSSGPSQGKIEAFFATPPNPGTVHVTVGSQTVTDIPDPNPSTGTFSLSLGGPQIGVIDYQKGEMTLQYSLANPPIVINPGSVTIEANADTTDTPIANSTTGRFSGTGITSGNVDYSNGSVTVKFAAAVEPETVTVTATTNSTTVTAADHKTDSNNGKLILNKSGSEVEVGSITYGTGEMSLTFPTNVQLVPGNVTVHALSPLTVLATDIADGNQGVFPGNGIFAGTINYDTKELAIDYESPPANFAPVLISYNYKRRSGIADHTATPLDDGKVLVVGGQDAGPIIGTPLKGALLFTPADNTTASSVEATGSMQGGRRFHTAALLSDNTVLVVGGEDESKQALPTSEIFTNGSFNSSGPHLNRARKLHKMINLKDCDPQETKDRILVVGGYGSDQLPLASAEIYDPTVSTTDFVLTDPMVTPRTLHALTCLPNGRVLVTGGVDQRGAVTFSAEIFDPAASNGKGAFLPVESGGMILERAGHTATLLSDGKILIVGGLNRFQQPLSSAEIYDPDQKLFTVSQSFLGFARFGQIALPWKGGVLIIGGADATGRALSLVESFVP